MLSVVSAELAQLRDAHRGLQLVVDARALNSGERRLFSLPSALLQRIIAAAGASASVSLADTSRALKAKLGPLITQVVAQQSTIQRPRTASEGAFSDSVSVSSAAATPSTASAATGSAVLSGAAGGGAGAVSQRQLRQQWFAAASAASSPIESDDVRANPSAVSQAGPDATQASKAGRQSFGAEKSKGRDSASAGGGLFRFGASKPKPASTPDRAAVPTTGSASSPFSPAYAAGEGLPRGKALDYEAASRLLARLQDAGRQVQHQAAVIADLSEKLRSAWRCVAFHTSAAPFVYGGRVCSLSLSLAAADTVKEFLSRQIGEKDDMLAKAIAARDALVSRKWWRVREVPIGACSLLACVAEAGIDKEVLSFLDERSTELEERAVAAEAERDRSATLASEARQTLGQVEAALDAARHRAVTAEADRDSLRKEFDIIRSRLGDVERRCAAAEDSAAAAETRVQQYEGMLAMSGAQDKRADDDARIAAEAAAEAVASAHALQRRVATLEGQLEAAGTKRGELEAALRLVELEAAAGAAERRAALAKTSALESQLARALSDAATSSASGAAAGSASGGATASDCPGDASSSRVEELIAERERLEARWKAERRALALEVRKLRTELAAAQGSVAAGSGPQASSSGVVTPRDTDDASS